MRIVIKDAPEDLTSMRAITEWKPYDVVSNGISTYKKPPRMGFLINDDNGKPIIVYENECEIINQ